MEFKDYILNQARLHPAMEPRDGVKLCFQAAFGTEHAAPSPEAAERYLAAELDSTEPDSEQSLFEPISDKVCRINLGAWKHRNLPAEWLLNIFLATERQNEDFPGLLGVIAELAEAGGLPFSTGEWQAFLRDYPVDEPYAVHHSQGYREAERPAYRIASARFIPALPVLEAMAGRDGGVVVIDGRAAAGKSSLAAALHEATGAATVQMDDFFLPLEKRTSERLGTPGGNVEHERFAEEVLPRLRTPEKFAYRRFDCSVMALSGERTVDAHPWRVVEGSYSMHPALGDYGDIKVLRTVESHEQLRRIVLRNGEAMAEKFKNLWIPMEEKYFACFDIAEKSDIIL